MATLAERAGRVAGSAAQMGSNFVNGPFAGRFAAWGVRGLGESGLRGLAFASGFADINAPARQAAIKKAGAGGILKGLGVPHADYLKASRSVPSKYKFMPKGHRLGAGLGLAFGAYEMYQGYQREGVWGAVKGGAEHAAIWGAFEIGQTALKTALQGTGMGGTIAGISKIALNPLVLAGVSMAYGAYKGAQYLSERGRNARKTEFAGDTASFNTQAAYTMRQRSLGEMNRGYGSARTLLGQEASIMHV